MNTRRIWLLLPLLLFTLALQVALAPYVRISSVAPDLMLVVTVLLSLHLPLPWAFGTGLAAGVLQDLWLGRYLGLFAFAKVLGALVPGILRRDLYTASSGVVALLITMATVFQEFWVGGVLWLVGWMPPNPDLFLRTLLIEALYHASLGVLLHPLIRRFAGLLKSDGMGIYDV